MSQATFNQLIAGISGGHVTAFFLVLARVGPLFVLAPLFSSKLIPVKVRLIVAVAISVGLTPVAAHGQHVPTAPLELAALIVEGMIVGLGFAFVLGAMTAAIHHAGAIVDAVVGLLAGRHDRPGQRQSGRRAHPGSTAWSA